MLRLIGVSLTALALVLPDTPPPARPAGGSAARVDVRDLIAAAHGAPAALCTLAARAVGNYGWGGAADAPVTPLPAESWRNRRERRDALSTDDVRFLLESLATVDPCVRELAVRLVAQEENDAVTIGLLQRLTAPDSSLRTVAALGLGLAEPKRAVEPLVGAIRDDAVGTRANAVWALGRIGDGRAVRPVTGALGDRSAIVREAAAGALGHLDSTSAVPALLRVLRDDPVASVRRTAAWALGQLEPRDAVQDLIAALRGDKDPGVREMSAWALGNMDAISATPALLAAARTDTDETVRETAVWALGEHGDNSAAEGLGQLLATDRNPRVRGTAAWALGQLDLKTAPKGLIDALADSETELRLKASWALSEIGDEAALPALRAALSREQDARARQAEVRALIHSGERTERLTELLKSQDPKVREAAIRGIAGHNGMDPWPWPQPRPRPFP